MNDKERAKESFSKKKKVYCASYCLYGFLYNNLLNTNKRTDNTLAKLREQEKYDKELISTFRLLYVWLWRNSEGEEVRMTAHTHSDSTSVMTFI